MSESRKYTPNNYHFLMAMYNWIVENNGIPHIAVPLDFVPQQIRHLGRDGFIILNINMAAASNLQIERDTISFNARFNGVSVGLCIPTNQVTAIFDRENPQKAGFTFQVCEEEDVVEATDSPEPPKRPGLSLVK